jgi:hypothetical protein
MIAISRMSPGTNQKGDVWRKIEAALVRRKEAVALSDLVSTADGYVVRFRHGIVDIVRTFVDGVAFEDQVRLDKLLDGVRGDFQAFA